MTPAPRVSVLSLNYRNAAKAVRCARTMAEQTYAPHMETLIIDNGSHDDSVGILQNGLSDIPNARLIETGRNDGFGAGYNRGASHASGEYLFFNNPDKLPQSDAIERMVALMDRDQNIGIVAPRLMHQDGTRRYSARRFPDLFDCVIKRTFLRDMFKEKMRAYLRFDLDDSGTKDVDWVIGGCFMIRRSLFEELGGFDESFFLFFEDIDLCRRCHMAGKKVVYFPDVFAYDRKRRLSEGGAMNMFVSKVGRAHMTSALRYFWKWRASPLPRRHAS